MKPHVTPLSDLQESDFQLSGGKAAALARLMGHGLPVPHGLCVLTPCYRSYLEQTGIGEKIALELARKDFAEMRWEEVWDCALRIRNFFLRTPLPDSLRSPLEKALIDRFDDRAVAVRSSAPGEDDASSSFAGLHESFINVRGPEEILRTIRLVWASLWSDSALLYRHELGLDVSSSTMAVVVQELVRGERSGVAFSMAPQDESQAVVESVWGLNQGLVDGTIEPDRWFLNRLRGSIVGHEPPSVREKAIRPAPEGTALVPLEKPQATNPPLKESEVKRVFRLSMELERLFGTPQDMEWTFRTQDLFLLQARPITTLQQQGKGDRRPWYLSLSRSYENLSLLGERIEREWLPAMESEADRMAEKDLTLLDDDALGREMIHRGETFRKWERIYWDEFIPFAHGVRLFGQYYNDRFRPEDPFSFVALLRGEEMRSTRRNRAIQRLADAVSEKLGEKKGTSTLPNDLREEIRIFLRRSGPLPGIALGEEDLEPFIRFLKNMGIPKNRKTSGAAPVTEESYLTGLPERERDMGRQLLELARRSWRLRDDDNIYLGRIEAERKRAVRCLAARIGSRRGISTAEWTPEELLEALEDPRFLPETHQREEQQPSKTDNSEKHFIRQIRGQPAGPGLTTGKARVIEREEDLAEFVTGEVLICDAIDPTMTFVVPMASAVVERRGGMLIHGAIIAREYGIPCITGIPEATRIVRTGDTVTVDGHLGLLIISQRADPEKNLTP